MNFTSPHESISCEVGIHMQLDPDTARVRFRWLALECHQEGPWRATQLEAEADALKVDGHECPAKRQGLHHRLVPRDRLVTTREALYSPASALRYMPTHQ